MRNLNYYNGLTSYHNNSSGTNDYYIYMNGISNGVLFDKNGTPLYNGDGSLRTATHANFQSYLTRLSETPDIFDQYTDMYIYWDYDKNGTFDYRGLAVMGEEVVYIEDVIIDPSVGENELKLKIKREINGTKYRNATTGAVRLYAENTIVRSVVNISQDTESFKYNNETESSGVSLFAPVVSGGNISVLDDINRWSNFNDVANFNLKYKQPVYIFVGGNGEVVCDSVGFLSSFNINTFNQTISISFKDKFMLYTEEDIIDHNNFKNTTIKSFLSTLLKMPKNMIIYPLSKSSNATYSEELGLHVYDSDSPYENDDFFNVDVLSTKEFSTYGDIISSICKELCFRMSFDSQERLVIQSDVKKSLELDLFETPHDDNFSTITEYNDLYNVEHTTQNQIIVNKIQNDFIKRDTFYNQDDFILKHVVFATYELFQSGSIATDVDVVVITSDSTHDNKTTWYKEQATKVGSTGVTMSWKFMGYPEADADGNYEFFEAVKYSEVIKVEDASVIKDSISGDPIFNTIEVKLGTDISKVNVEDYVMMTDGNKDFIGMVKSINKGVINIGEKGSVELTSVESTDRDQTISYTDRNGVDYIRSIVPNTGTVNNYTFEGGILSINMTGGSPYKTYSNKYTKVYEYDITEDVPTSHTVTVDYTSPFTGHYTGKIELTNSDVEYGAWTIYGAEEAYQTNTTKPAANNSAIGNTETIGSYEYKWVVNRRVHTSTSNYYTKHYNTYKIRYRRRLKFKATYTGDLLLNTYKYYLNVFTDKDVFVEDESVLSDSTVTVSFGFDKDYQINYFGRLKHLEDSGYKAPMDYYLYYVRNELPYVWEYNRNANTATMRYPMLPGQNLETNGNFGGIDDGEKKFAGMVDGIDSIFDTFTNEQLLYSREYHQSMPVYVRTNNISPDSDKFRYSTYDNSNVALTMTESTTEYEASDYFGLASEIETENSSDSDFLSIVSNMKFGFDIIAKADIVLDESNTITEGTTLTALDWTNDDIASSNIRKNYKVVFGGSTIFIDRDFFEIVYTTRTIAEMRGSKAVKVADISVYDVGDVITLDKSNEGDLDTVVIYRKYNDSRWLVVGIDRGENILFLDYEFPVGVNSTIPAIRHFKYDKVLIFQEFGFKGNPFTEETISIRYENTPSIQKYFKKQYDGLTGKFLSIDDLQNAVSYLADGFGGTNNDTTKYILPLELDNRYDIELLDMVQINEGIFSGMTGQKALVVGKQVEVNQTKVSFKYKVMTVGSYTKSNDVAINTDYDYAPINKDKYNHDGTDFEETPDDVNLNNVVINKYDKSLGNIMLLEISTDTMVAKVKTQMEDSDTNLTVYNVSSYYDNTKDLDNKKYYTDSLLEIGKKVFVRVNNEFMLATVVDNIKATQRYIDEDDNITIQNGIVTSAQLDISNRGAFDTESNFIEEDSDIQFYQITGMANEDGYYSTAISIGDKFAREYFEFDIINGLSSVTGRGKVLISTNEDWVESAKDILRETYDDELVNSLEENDVVKYLGGGVIQVGSSADDSQYLRYSPVGGLELKGKVSITTGDLSINDLTYDNNFITMTDTNGYLGIGTRGILAKDPDVEGIESYMQLGQYGSNNYFLFTQGETGTDDVIEIVSENISLSTPNTSSFVKMNSEASSIGLNTLGEDADSRFQIGAYYDDYLQQSQDHMLYTTEGGTSALSIKASNMFLGNDSNFLMIDEKLSSKLSLNDGRQQLGTGIKDTSSPIDYNGFYVGDSIDGVGNLRTGRYIKFDGTNFQFGSMISIYSGDVPMVDIKDFVDEGYYDKLKGNTVFTDNLIRIYSEEKYREATSLIDGSPLTLTVNQTNINTDIVDISYISPTITNFDTDMEGVIDGLFIKLVDSTDPEVEFEFKILSVAPELTSFKLNGYIPKEGVYEMYIENLESSLVTIGDLDSSPFSNEVIRMGRGLSYDESGAPSTGLHINDGTVNGSHFMFDTALGLSVKSTDGLIDMHNMRDGSIVNQIYLNESDDSFININDKRIQLGILSTDSSISKYNGHNGIYFGDRDSDYVGSGRGHSYIAYSVENGVEIRGSISLSTGTSVEDAISNSQDEVIGIINNIDLTNDIVESNYEPQTKIDGMIWIDTDDGNVAYIWREDANKWAELSTTGAVNAQTLAETKNATFVIDTIYGSYPADWYVDDLIDRYEHPDSVFIKDGDMLIINNYYKVGSGAMFKFTTDIDGLTSITNTSIVTKDKFVLISTNNDSYIEIASNSSAIRFTDDTSEDYIKIAYDGTSGVLSVGELNSTNFLYYDTNAGLSINTTNNMKLHTANLDVISGNVGIQSGRLDLSSSSFNLNSTDIVMSSGNFSLSSANVSIDSNSTFEILSGRFLLSSDDIEFNARGDISIHNDTNIVRLDSNGVDSKIILNKSISGASSDIIFQLGDSLRYDKSDNLYIDGTIEIDSPDNDNITIINDQYIYNRSATQDANGQPINYTRLTKGNIEFKTGNYINKVNVKTASGQVLSVVAGESGESGKYIDLRNFANGESWENTKLLIFYEGINNGATAIKSFDYVYDWVDSSKQKFRVRVWVNGVEKTNIKLNWYAYETSGYIQNIILETTESTSRTQHTSHSFSDGISAISNIYSNTGTLSHSLSGNILNVTASSGAVFRTYSNSYTKSYVYDYNAGIPNSHSISKSYSSPFSGTYVGTISKTSNTVVYGGWSNYGSSWVGLSDASSAPSNGTVISSNGISGTYEYRTVVYSSSNAGYWNYRNHWTVNYIQQRRKLTRNVSYTGNLYLNTYKYNIYVYYNN